MNVFVVFLLLCVTREAFGENDIGDTCKDENGNSGVCTLIRRCSSAREALKKNIRPKICSFEGTEPIICCIITSEPSGTVSDNFNLTHVSNTSVQTNISSITKRVPGEISRAKCKEYTKYSYRQVVTPVLSVVPQSRKIYECNIGAEALIISTIKAGRQEFPHMAHIGFSGDEENGVEKHIYSCGGTLISEIFVLTAAHCLFHRECGPPTVVRFGITNVNDSSHRQISKVKDVFRHPEYSPPKRYNDIGLIQLKDPVDFTPYVRPACLNKERDIISERGVATGWGALEKFGTPSEDLSKSILNIVSFEKCHKFFQTDRLLPIGIVDDSMICAAITSHQRKDTCQGDSGSPLQLKMEDSEEEECMYNIIGVTSFGKLCGELNVPGVYTRVSHYIDWIEDKVWPENRIN